MPNSNFNSILWAGKPNDESRTTNGAEVFHRHFNNQFYNPHLYIFQIIDILLNIQAESELKLKALKDNVNNYRCNKTRKYLFNINNLYEKYIQGEINQLEYLKLIGTRYCGKKIIMILT